MREVSGDVFSADASALCVTTNGIRRADGRAVMGAGIAKAAAARYPGIDARLGAELGESGNHTRVLHSGGERPWEWEPRDVVALPTKEHWRAPSPLGLVLRSARELRELADERGWESVIAPRPGCGLGGLSWEELRVELSEIWDERFLVSSGP